MEVYKDSMNEIMQQLMDQRDSFLMERNAYPEGTMYRQVGKNGVRYYQAYKENGKIVRKGITRKPEMIRRLARKQYIEKSIEILDYDIDLLSRTIENFKCTDPEKVIASMKRSYAELHHEYFFNINMEAQQDLLCEGVMFLDGNSFKNRMFHHRQWSLQNAGKDDFRLEGRDKITSKGQRMRSKSEVIIAERLYYYDVPFVYEKSLCLSGYTFHPDFSFEDKDYNEFYLEYCGMMDDEEYVSKHIWKKQIYESNGIVPWKNIIYMYESSNKIDLKNIDYFIQNEILPRL